MVSVETDEVTDLLEQVAEEYITPRFRMLRDGEVHEKNPGDLVTVADHEAEFAITEVLGRAYPGAMILGEEASAGDPSLLERFRAAEHAFTIDPVDGTKNFVHGSPDHAVMVAEVRDGRTVRAWIHQPQHHQTYVAEVGAGAYRNGERLRRPALLGTDPAALRGRTSVRDLVGRTYADLPPLELSWVCCGIDYPNIIEGEADFIIYSRTMPWDHAPGALLLAETGGGATDWDAQPYAPSGHGRGVLAAGDQPSLAAAAARLEFDS